MSLLSAEDQEHVRHYFEALTEPVRMVLFTDSRDCQYCGETRQIVEEVAALSPRLFAEAHDLRAEPELAALYQIDRAPAIAILRDGAKPGDPPKDFGIRYYGIPSGYEFSSLLEDLVMVSTGQHQLSAATLSWLETLDRPVHLQVFVTPTCPYCPQMVKLTHRMALASEHVRADMVEATEFPELSDRYGVYGVPRTVIDEDDFIEGAVPEARLASEMKKALSGAAPLARDAGHGAR